MASPAFSPASAAIDHLSGAYERLTLLRAILLSSSPAKLSTTAPTISLLDKALGCLSTALSKLQSISPYRTTAVEDTKKGSSPRKLRRKKMQSWTIVTSVPHVDGHQWRKYGQKLIIGAEFPRSYFKCTYSNDQGCPATKTVQKKEDNDANPPKYEVRYSMQHICKSMETGGLPSVMDSSVVMDGSKTTSDLLHNPSTSGGRAASPELLSSARFLPPIAWTNDEYSLREQEHFMEPMLHSTELQGEEKGGAGSSSVPWSPLSEVDFDWEWLMS